MSQFSAWQFVVQNVVFVTVVMSGFLFLGIFLLLQQVRRKSERKAKRQGLAACWLATLSELSHALDRMQETTRRLIRDRQRPAPLEIIHKSDIYTHRWLREGFLLMAGAQAGASLVGSINRDCDFFLWNVNQTTNARVHMLDIPTSSQVDRGALQQTVDDFDDATIAFACNHHHDMVGEWKESAELLNSYCIEHELWRGDDLVIPSNIPLKWQRDDTKPWTVENLAFVGEHEWEP